MEKKSKFLFWLIVILVVLSIALIVLVMANSTPKKLKTTRHADMMTARNKSNSGETMSNIRKNMQKSAGHEPMSREEGIALFKQVVQKWENDFKASPRDKNIPQNLLKKFDKEMLEIKKTLAGATEDITYECLGLICRIEGMAKDASALSSAGQKFKELLSLPCGRIILGEAGPPPPDKPQRIITFLDCRTTKL